jgi:formylmethanofuran dehydrogenase subunit E
MCPGLAIGYRAAMSALKRFKRATDEELVTVVENDSCAVDAIQFMTGCTLGKGNLIFRDYGKQVYTFIKRPGGEALRLSFIWKPPEESTREKKIKAILRAKETEIFKIKRLKLTPPPEARVFGSVACGICGEKVMEPRARLKDGVVVCIPCFEGGHGPRRNILGLQALAQSGERK